MQTELQLILTPEQAHKPDLLRRQIAQKLNIDSAKISLVRILRKSIDARSVPKINLAVQVYYNKKAHEKRHVEIN